MTVTTTRPVKRFHELTRFRITDDDSRLVRLNVVKILTDVCFINYGFQDFSAVADYEEPAPA